MSEIPAIPVHHTAVKDGAWDGPAAEAACSDPISKATGQGEWAWYDADADDPDGDGYPDSKSAYKFPHHFVSNGKPGAASMNGVNNALARLSGADIPDADRAGVEAHLNAHKDDNKGADKKKSQDGGEYENLARQFGIDMGVTPGLARTGMASVRAIADAPWEFRDADKAAPGMLGTLTGHFAVFREWTEIDSFWEGRFLEQIAPGAFKKTFSENMKGMRCLVQHGKDPQVGMKPLGPIQTVREDDTGAYYEVGLMDTSYNRDLLPGIENGLYGASFRFQVIREEVNTKPERSDYNPEGIEERSITEAKVREFGPVTFPAYENATAGIRSLNGEVLGDVERFAQLLTHLRSRDTGAEDANVISSGLPAEKVDAVTAPPTEKKNHLHLSGAARRLRTSSKLEEPQWKL